jgi:hypothetical protein
MAHLGMEPFDPAAAGAGEGADSSDEHAES